MSLALKMMERAAKGEGPLRKIHLQGGVTQGRLLREPIASNKKNEAVVRKSKGMNYAVKFQNEPDADFEEEELRSRFQESMDVKPPQFCRKRMSSVDDATSLDTRELNAAMEDLNAVYDTYEFADAGSSETKNLLINNFKDDILKRIDANNVVVIKGPTGCGKTTQVPLFLLDDARKKGIYCNIIVTQPRKIAATSIAQRICEQRGWALGTLVGYQIGLDKMTHKSHTRLTFVTAGVLLQKLVCQQLEEYTHIIVDEVHERENETDFILIILKQLIKMSSNRKKLILMSATMDSDKFTNYFKRQGVDHPDSIPPVIDLPQKRTFEVLYHYLDDVPLLKLEQIELDANRPMVSRNTYYIASALVEMFRLLDIKDENPSDRCAALIFLPGIVEIENMHKVLEADNQKPKQKLQCFICPLHSSMSFEEQMKVFAFPPPGQRKVILATNIAESSVTLPDVKYVIDFCLTKRQVQDQNTFYSSLHSCWESKSQADQRAGRTGRTMRGRVYRLVDKAFFDAFDQDSPPEMLRCPLDRLVLKAKQLDMGPPADILGRAMDPPDLSTIERTILNLKELGALTLQREALDDYDEQDGDLTFTGQVMAELPLDTQLSKLILIGHLFSVLRECVIMASLMTGRNIFTSPLTKKMEVYNVKMGWEGGSKSDPITALCLYQAWKDKKGMGLFQRSGGETEQQWASRNFVHLKALREVEKLEIEIFKRLDKMDICDTRVDLVKGKRTVVPLILKVCLAGACYPNFFLPNQIDEEQAVKTLGNRDPSRTVYFRNFPAPKQPGPLYRDVIKDLLKDCGSGLKVQFDGSSRVYVEFESSVTPHESVDSKIELDVPVPGKVMVAVYRAVQMRIFDFPMKVPLMQPAAAREKAEKTFGDCLYPNALLSESIKFEGPDGSAKRYRPRNRMPGLNKTIVSLIVTHVVDPSNFYVVLEDESMTKIHEAINDLGEEGVLVDLDPQAIAPGTLCLGQYTEPGRKPEWYRAMIVVASQKGVKVQYIDYGNYELVKGRNLKGYGPKLLAENIHEEPPMAIRCRLAEIQPKPCTGVVQWSEGASDYLRKSCCYFPCGAKIYSVVNDTIAVLLYPSDLKPASFDLPLEESVNYLLVQKGHAKFVEEPYLSKEDHERREQLSKRGDVVGPDCDDFQAFMDSIQIEPLLEKDVNAIVRLHGPLSPLEMKAFPITRKCLGNTINVDSNSVNSTLINENPMDTTDRLLVAGSVNQSQYSSSLTARNTTLMPPIRGLSGMLALLFSPKSELRVSPTFTHYTGALCGLGCDDSGLSFDQENDIEITFDCIFDTDDLEKMNRIRFWMDKVLCRSLDEVEHAASGPGMYEVQRGCVKYLLELFSTEKTPVGTTCFSNKYEWNQVPEESILLPTKDESKVYKLIRGVSLRKPSREEEVSTMSLHLMKINMYINGMEPMKVPVTCLFCQHYVENVRSLDFHVKTRIHKMRVSDFFSRLEDAELKSAISRRMYK